MQIPFLLLPYVGFGNVKECQMFYVALPSSQSMDESESVSNCRFMVVFQYGSAVLFNVDDNDVDSYLDIVRRHASGLLTEMRKDGQCYYLACVSQSTRNHSFTLLICH